MVTAMAFPGVHLIFAVAIYFWRGLAFTEWYSHILAIVENC
jgi:hypothetical protein